MVQVDRGDPGEASRVCADERSDGDGVVDGIEDANKNGRLDVGERNPGLADGLVDGLAGPGSSSRPGCAGGDAGGTIGLALVGLALVIGRRRRVS